MTKEVLVSILLGEQDIRVGRLWFHAQKGRESASFEYEKDWLTHPERFALEPALKFVESASFGSIGDSAPDRWGRVLMQRAHNANLKEKSTTPSSLSALDYLLWVNDESRQGALRFSLPHNDRMYLTPRRGMAIPPLVHLATLLSATERLVENDENADDLRLLLAPGSSLGGTRPKASIRDLDGTLSIAKFPKNDDEHNVVVWEAVVLTLARDAGIRVPVWRLVRVLDKPILIMKRFDRENGGRVPFLSAMSMLDARDNEQHSYLELTFALAEHGAAPKEDMQELWRRIVFTIMISNTDDHLRNHGFTYTSKKGWRLSPAYDMNPTPLEVRPRVLTTAIDFDNATASLDVALSVAQEFGLSQEHAHEIIHEVRSAVQGWRTVAKNVGLSKAECDRMASAFQEV